MTRDGGVVSSGCYRWCAHLDAIGCEGYTRSLEECVSECGVNEWMAAELGCTAEYQAMEECVATATFTCNTANCEMPSDVPCLKTSDCMDERFAAAEACRP